MFDEIPISTIELSEGRFQTFPDISTVWIVSYRKFKTCDTPATLKYYPLTSFMFFFARSFYNVNLEQTMITALGINTRWGLHVEPCWTQGPDHRTWWLLVETGRLQIASRLTKQHTFLTIQTLLYIMMHMTIIVTIQTILYIMIHITITFKADHNHNSHTCNTPVGTRGLKSIMCPPYPHACRKRRLKWGAVI